MRFLKTAPDIPRELIDANRQGEVVFFCGAGVSSRVDIGNDKKMPGFWDLTNDIIEALDPDPVSDIQKWFNHDCDCLPTPYADIYQAMQDEFGAPLIENELSKFLNAKSSCKSEQHELILNLSKNINDQPQVVTTNIDPLFTHAWPEKDGVKIFEPPRLPDGEFDGVVYLHGRMKPADLGLERKNYIFSTSDFGRAYLSEAWATRFIKELLASGKSIVFLGYSADDAPVKFLLQALHASEKTFPLYAFADYNANQGGTPEQVHTHWQNKGVTAMPYPSQDDGKDHSALWDALAEWDKEKNDAPGWEKSMQELALQSPKELEPYQRGQILDWVRTSDGCKFFNENEPVPPAEWICVFDEHLRQSDPTYLRENETIQTHEPIQESLLRAPEYKKADFEILNLLVHEETKSMWFRKQMQHPGLLWWAAGLNYIPSWLIDAIKIETINPNKLLSDKSVILWELYLETISENQLWKPGNYPISPFIDVIERLNNSDPATAEQLHKLKKVLTPVLRVDRKEPTFPSDASFETTQGTIVEFSITIPVTSNEIEKLQVESFLAGKCHEINCIFCDALLQYNLLQEQIGGDVIDWPPVNPIKSIQMAIKRKLLGIKKPQREISTQPESQFPKNTRTVDENQFLHDKLISDKFTEYEKRNIIRKLSDDERRVILLNLRKETWEHTRSCLTKFWPKDRIIKTGILTNAMVQLALACVDDFEDAVNTILPLCGKTEQMRNPAYFDEIAKNHPTKLLQLMYWTTSDNPRLKPYCLREILDKTSELKRTKEWKRLDRIASANVLLN